MGTYVYLCIDEDGGVLNIVNLPGNFISQDNGGMMSLLGMLEQCLKTGKKQLWHAASVTNMCVGLLAGLKVLICLMHPICGFGMCNFNPWSHAILQALLALRSHGLGLEILNSAQAIFQVWMLFVGT